jgi:hypothetical protein
MQHLRGRFEPPIELIMAVVVAALVVALFRL